ncbi:MAG: hypothetical protein HQL32_18165, partial [Planctomycetes bacterium]|nr:hypothetical protein [Planctomycetota bacterium]
MTETKTSNIAYIRGYGLITGLGEGVGHNYQRMANNETAITVQENNLTASFIPSSCHSICSKDKTLLLPALLDKTITECLQHANLTPEDLAGPDTALFYATTKDNILAFEDWIHAGSPLPPPPATRLGSSLT